MVTWPVSTAGRHVGRPTCLAMGWGAGAGVMPGAGGLQGALAGGWKLFFSSSSVGWLWDRWVGSDVW